VGQLPLFHPVTLKLPDISADCESPLSAAEEVFRSDPALTADLLRKANSVEFGLQSRIETIRRALTYLGLQRVRSLATAIACGFYVRNSPPTEDMRAVWCHSVATAVIANAIGFLRLAGNEHGSPAARPGPPGIVSQRGASLTRKRWARNLAISTRQMFWRKRGSA
jgi:hypothetical protein